MFCQNCGTELEKDTNFCQKCQIKTSNNKHNKKTKFKLFLIIIISLLVISIGGIILNFSYGFEKLSWNKEYSDLLLEYVTQSNIKLGINFSNPKKIKDIKYSVSCGKIKNNDLEIDWDLTSALGKCEITITYKSKKISKVYKVISYDMSEQELALDYQIDLDSSEDLDFDNLTNKQEKEYGTNPLLADTDMDGLDDDYEIFTSKTDPTKKDTDGDGLNDYDEIKLGLDPLKADSKNDGQKDGERILTYDYTNENISLSITGKGNIASTVSEINTNTKISSKKGLIDNLYTFYTDGTVTEAIVTISYTEEELEKYDLTEDHLAIYYYNTKESKYEKIETTIDKESKTLKAKLTHFSSYVVGDSRLVNETNSTQVLFILDNSWSMYSNEQYKEITGKDYSSELGASDKEGKRFSLTKDLVEKLSKKGYNLGLSEFRYDYVNILEIGNNANDFKEKLDVLNGKFYTKSEGTNIKNALTNGIKEFSKESDNKYIVILTDGEDYVLNLYTEEIVGNALKNNVKICSIGFKDASNNVALANISNATGCHFYSSSNVNGLSELFENIDAELNDDLVDLDDNGEADGILIADSGFIVNRDGFSFPNYNTNLSSDGHCYGMATFAELYYKKVLPLNVDSITAKNDKSYAYNLKNTYFKKYSNLYDYSLKTNALKYLFGFDVFGEDTPADFRKLKGDILVINDTYKKEFESLGIYDIKIVESTLSKEAQIAKWGVNYKESEKLLLNEDKMQSSSVIDNDDKQLINAIYASFIKQNVTSYYSSSTNFWLWLRNVVGTEVTDYTGADSFINILTARLNDNDAPVISSDFNNGLHAINAISLVQDIDNPNYYHIGVYDNNYPGEKRYVDIECNNKKCVTKANQYYSNSNQPIRITPSLEYDLEYYKNYER